MARTQELQKNIAILQQSEDLAQIGSWEYDLATRQFSWSGGMYSLLGKKQGTPVSPETYLEQATPACRPNAQRVVDHLTKDHQPFEETLHVMVGETEKIIRVKGTVLPDSEGRPQKLIGLDLDITNISEAEAKVRDTEDLVRELPIYLNNCLANRTGLTNEQLVQLGFEGRLQLIHPDDRARIGEFNNGLLLAADEEVKMVDYRLQAGGRTRWVRNRSRVFRRNKEGRPTQLLTILQDISDAYASQESLAALNTSLQQKARELETKNEEITSFAFVASHDLKEPIRKIHTFTDLLIEKESGHLSERGQDLLRRMEASVHRLDFMISDILALIRINAENSRFTRVNLARLLQKFIADLQEPIAASGAEIKVEDLPTVRAIETQVFYLFKNLISNAIKFQPAGNKPQVTIRSEVVKEFSLKPGTAPADFLRVDVRDNGIGFENTFREKVFQIFKRLHPKDAFPGTGMGLTICRKVMDNHNGFIDAESTLGRGTTFSCYFPL